MQNLFTFHLLAKSSRDKIDSYFFESKQKLIFRTLLKNLDYSDFIHSNSKYL